MKKIMLNNRYGLTQAVLDRRKTKTRRIVTERLFQECRSNGWIEAGGFNAQWKEKALALLLKSSPYKVGEEIAVAQRYEEVIDPIDWINVAIYKLGKGWSNKMFVKAELMPHRIKITNISVERLQDISEEDCLKEGVIYYEDIFGKGFMLDEKYNNNYRRHCFTTARKAFSYLIDKTCGKGTWDSNPYVFVYEFELIK